MLFHISWGHSSLNSALIVGISRTWTKHSKAGSMEQHPGLGDVLPQDTNGICVNITQFDSVGELVREARPPVSGRTFPG
jgi:hypothetical protein